MKKLQSHTEMRKGRIYNRVYVGSNEAYARINGKETFLVLQTEPELQTVELFDQFGSPYEDDIRGDVTSYGMPDKAFEDFEIYEPKDDSEWFKKSIQFPSLKAALERGLIKREAIKEMANWSGNCPFVATMKGAPTYGLQGVHCRFNVEDETEHPLLQAVFVVWDTWEAMKADFKQLNINVRT